MAVATLTPTFSAVTEINDGEIVVRAWVRGVEVDRRDTHGYVVKDERMARRLSTAIEAGAVFYDFEIRTDVNGKTFLGYRSHVLGRMMNADLRRLGF